VVPVLNVPAIANVPRAVYYGRPLDAFLLSSAAIAAFQFSLAEWWADMPSTVQAPWLRGRSH
jgi:hypothetical protein